MTARQVDVTCSYLLNNLASNGKLLAFASQSRVPIITEEISTSATIATVEAPNDTLVMQCSWCTFADGPSYLVLALKTGVQVWGADGKRMLHRAPLAPIIAKEVTAIDVDPDQHANGICSFSVNEVHCLCVGTSVGTVAVFHYDMASVKFTLEKTVRAKPVESRELAVTALASSKLVDGRSLLARADLGGSIQLWTTVDGSAFELGRTLSADGLCCTGVCVREHVVVSSYSSGEIRCHSALSGTKLAQITAHVRWINALTLHPAQWLVAAAAEDSYVSVWAITPFNSGSESLAIKNVSFWNVADGHMSGVAFHGLGGKTVTASMYDSTVLTTWKLP